MPLRNFRLRNNNPPKAAQAKPESFPAKEVSNPDAFFPFAPYVSAAGVHVCLLAFTALYLPRTSLSFLTNLDLFRTQNATHTEAFVPRTDALYLLTINPLRTVVWMCGGTLVLQAWWAGWLRSWSIEMRTGQKGDPDAAEMTKQKLERNVLNNQGLEASGKAAITTLVASLAFHIVIVLFGAPIASHTLETYSLALLLALLTIWTPGYVLGPPSLGSSTEALVIRLTWIRLFAELRPRTAIERAMVYPAIGAALGCWSGAIPIGLDWERPWQAWPLTPTYGAISGYFVGTILALIVSGVTQLARTDVLSNALPTKQTKSRQR